jgi:hypothetical protein
MLCLDVLPCTRLLLFVTYTVALPTETAVSTSIGIIHLLNLNLLLLRRLNLIHHIHILI